MRNKQKFDAPSVKHWQHARIILFVLLIACAATAIFPTQHVYSAGVSPAAFAVYGQAGSFTSNTANNGGVSASSLSSPYGVDIDAISSLSHYRARGHHSTYGSHLFQRDSWHRHRQCYRDHDLFIDDSARHCRRHLHQYTDRSAGQRTINNTLSTTTTEFSVVFTIFNDYV